MPLERKPVEQQDDPGYPSSNEYATGRRAFLGLLGLTALGVGGAYLLKSKATADPIGNGPEGPVGGIAPPTRLPGRIAVPQSDPAGARLVSPTIPQAATPGETVAPKPPAQPQAVLKGDVVAPKPPHSQPIAPPPGTPPKPAGPEAEPLGEAPAQPVQPRGNIRGRIRAVQPPAQPEGNIAGGIRAPVQPQAEVGGKTKPPARPPAMSLGIVAPIPPDK